MVGSRQPRLGTGERQQPRQVSNFTLQLKLCATSAHVETYDAGQQHNHEYCDQQFNQAETALANSEPHRTVLVRPPKAQPLA